MPHSRSRFWRPHWVPATTALPILRSVPRWYTPKSCSCGMARVASRSPAKSRPSFCADLSFRVSGRAFERLVDVGAHVNAGDLRAGSIRPSSRPILTPRPQLWPRRRPNCAWRRRPLTGRATSCRAASRRASPTTTRRSNCEPHKARLNSAKAELGRAREALGDTELHARAAGVITARSLEVGQIVQAAQSVFTLAQDGERDAVFDVPELMFWGQYLEGGQRFAGAGFGS